MQHKSKKTSDVEIPTLFIRPNQAVSLAIDKAIEEHAEPKPSRAKLGYDLIAAGLRKMGYLK